MQSTDKQATRVVLSRKIRPEREGDFKAWIEGFNRELGRFPGHLGSQVIPPVEGGNAEWVFVYTFETPQQLRVWLDSDVRKDWLKGLEPMVLSQSPMRVMSGLEQLFGLLPPDVAPPPPVWKVAVSVFAGLFPLTIINQLWLGPFLSPLPLFLRGFLSASIMVISMTWLVMPIVTRLLKPWLYPKLS